MNNSIFTSAFYAQPSKLRTVIIAGLFTLFLCCLLLIINLLMPYLIHSGKEVTVPSLIGKDIQKGSALLSELGLQIQEVKEVFSGQAPAGIILNQNPLPNSVVREGRRLYITVSKGMEGDAMPNLVGKSLREARILLMQQGLELGVVHYEFSELVQQDRIMAQSVQYGAKISSGEQVSLTISKGQEAYPVPSLIGKTIAEAEETIVAAGFVLGGKAREHNETYLSGIVIAQDPAGGTMSPKETPINLTVSE
ncbi:MAG TPA: PASTA domain-containing protein [Candidatus Kapabacteria bacterium]|nr:PASTA domain-containing protein [Ignavibacteria bacterium]HRI30504.1 PASTA domain-containing protein [Candidatus Kapabacteria bacterium]HRK59883.1 PASTA domain-containing protein [Candidatus Kapabacteria bacterium]